MFRSLVLAFMCVPSFWTPDFPIFLNVLEGGNLERWFSSEDHVLLFQNTHVGWLTTVRSSSSRGSHAPTCLACAFPPLLSPPHTKVLLKCCIELEYCFEPYYYLTNIKS